MYAAEQIAAANKAGNVNITVRDPDVSFGFLDANGTYHTDYSNYNGGFPNSITVITRRDNIVNSPVSLFFAPIFGNATSSTPYQAGNGTGQNATYAVVGFVGAMVSQADGSGSNMNILIQPTAVVDPTASMPNPQPVGTAFSQFGSGTSSGPVIRTFASAKLTQ
jgi:hypothetical protein